MEEIEILSVNIGRKKVIEIGGKKVETGIFKFPTSAQVQVNKEGIIGDVIEDKLHHGGLDQAVYIYNKEDYAWWEENLGKELPIGVFGENITVSTFPKAIRIGDRLSTNSLVLEVTAPRIPCAKLAARMGDTNFVKKFVDRKRPGIYVRVLELGTVKIGDKMKYVSSGERFPTVKEFFDLWYEKKHDPVLVRAFLESPIAERARLVLENWLDKN